ncbi:MAG TPA: LysR family transcriptional regulator, partial [Sphingomicrobium sp.]|nr:LysR family transcriptional regulator [Sphingomicrobium sp.]
MSAPDSPKIRRDGWTPERQLRFLDTLAETRSVTRAAESAGMSRESAYRLRDRGIGALFAALWDRALLPEPVRSEGHNRLLTERSL